jgi:hypothetical protein
MRAAPTLEGGLRIDAEDLSDWEVLHAILHDAQCGETDLATELGNLITDEKAAEDWAEYVTPDLREGFQNQISLVADTIRKAMEKAGGEAGPIWITKDNGLIWYGALNQARLALEELHHFGPGDEVAVGKLGPASKSAFLRSQFYLALQSLLLDHVMS